ncbi:MAG: hypothetical protein A3K19_03375 [Lentisphaerae bacterium RIFOXYB12_FULL_65_16]|nr:MAG: hypothetical protein A3K19_03375 [Lentisphaerae bacterium RIFOXYB12_FULL_65_16]
MTAFLEYLTQRFAAGGFTTEDALTGFLPLLRQVVEAHAAGLVAPLNGLAALRVENACIWFENAARQPPQSSAARVRELDPKPTGAIEVLSEQRRTTDVTEGSEKVIDLHLGRRDEPLTRPVYLPGYVCWEHLVGHHDPPADVFCLGMILGSMSCGLDFNDPEQLQTFVAHRDNLFRLNPRLHPVLAKAVVCMTELSRYRRPPDLRTVLHSLENYRDQAVDLDCDLASRAGAGPAPNRRPAVLARLQERLFEISQRNRLLHFKPTLSSINLTHASVPLSLDVGRVRPEQILTWGGPFKADVVGGRDVLLNRYLNFTEVPYLSGSLDHIRAEAQRDQAEFGFQQLRLALCFLRWADVKSDPPVLYNSPLVLLPVRLLKKKGVRDSFWLQPLEDEAEVNPGVRYLFKQLYGIELPETLELTTDALDAFHQLLTRRVQASEPGIAVTKVDRPRIDVVHDLARRRLDAYNRQACLAGCGVRNFLDLDYSYDADNFHPLGLRLFAARIRRTDVLLKEILQETPAPPQYFQPETAPAAQQKEKRFYSLRQGGDNPYAWEFDLCSVTLGNFKYRKMSLVRDYAELLESEPENAAFDTVFSLAPRPVGAGRPAAPAPEDRYHVVSCDPTQAAAIGMARVGLSYIIQGPPGTGKSQTITNLIADYMVRGQRVLFVCEKRAAIDVVFHRLEQRGLGDLCCLVHDSQADKKDVIADLKRTYEVFLAEDQAPRTAWQRRRQRLLRLIRQELTPLAQYHAAMTVPVPSAGVPLRALLDRALALRDERPELSPLLRERLPPYEQWATNRERIGRFRDVLYDIQRDGVLAGHPLRHLAVTVTRAERPLELLLTNLDAAGTLLQRLRAVFAATGVPAELWATPAQAMRLAEFAARLAPVADWNLLAALDPASETARLFRAKSAAQRHSVEALRKAQELTRNWTFRLPREEVAIALLQARQMEGALISLLKPAWWRLRKVLNQSYNFSAHAVKPSWSYVLDALEKEYAAAAVIAHSETAFQQEFGFGAPVATVSAAIDGLLQELPGLAAEVREFHACLMSAGVGAGARVKAVAAAGESVRQLHAALAAILDRPEEKTLDGLATALGDLRNASDQLPEFLQCLTELAALSEPLARAFRELPLNPVQLEAAIADRTLTDLFRTDRRLNRFTGGVRRNHLHFLDACCRRWEDINAAVVRETVRRTFLDHVRLSAAPASGLPPEQREFKRAYVKGRKELEHEFGKTMRFKSIRDLFSGDAGTVLRDLKPVWLMSPLSVSDTVPLTSGKFDVVIFDEASQIPLEEAVPAIFRAAQAIVVGDEMQLPPTNFFSAKRDGDNEALWAGDEDGEGTEYDLSANSFLSHAARNMPAQMLGWHYRSRSESLISFSNWAFYQGRLLTVPEEELAGSERDALVAAAPEDGQTNAAKLLNRPVSFHFMPKALYLNRRNRMEADYIAHLVRALLSNAEQRPTLGVVAFSEAQQDEIESALDRLACTDAEFAARLEAEYEREENGQFTGLLVKNLENIQGDERDIIILSVCYGHGPDGRILMNFGPINQSGGEKRLNVAFSRAKHHMAVISSMQAGDIRNDYNDGANCLKSYLRYAACVSTGDTEGARRVLRDLAAGRDELAESVRAAAEQSVATTQLAEALRRRGYTVDLGVGMSDFRCDLAVRREGDSVYRLGILVDTQEYYRQTDIIERDLMKPRLLEAFGWRITSVLTKDWYEDGPAVLERLEPLLNLAPNTGTPAAAAPPPPVADLDAMLEREDLDDPAPASAPPADGPVASAAEDVDDPDDIDDPDDPEVTSPAPDAGRSRRLTMPLSGQPDPADGESLYLECTTGRASKFWEIRRDGASTTVRYGRIGTTGQSRQAAFHSDAAAAAQVSRLIREKLGKGYRQVVTWPTGESGEGRVSGVER